MLVHILGAAAGGGFPQWNCQCPGCCKARQGEATTLTQSSIAIAREDDSWFLVNASPNVHQQLEALRKQHLIPTSKAPFSARTNPISAIFLTDAEIDHTTGLILLRESATPLSVYGTEQVKYALTAGYPLLPTLQNYCRVEWTGIELGKPIFLGDDGALEVEGFLLSTKPPKYMQCDTKLAGAWGIGLTFYDHLTGRVLTYAPGLATLNDQVRSRFAASDCILVDGTFWSNDELPNLGITSRTAQDMGHCSLSGDSGSLSQLAQLSGPRKILVHINNTNPVLIHNSPERRSVEALGVEIGYDGLTVKL